MTACGFKTCNFNAASSLTHCVFASVATVTGVRELPGGIQHDFPVGCDESGAEIYTLSAVQAEIE